MGARHTHGAARWVSALTAALLLGLLGCGGKTTAQAPVPTATTTFSHPTHLAGAGPVVDANGGEALHCADCHTASAATGWRVQRPGSAAHAPCDRCHADAFYAAPGPLCTACHAEPPDPRRPEVVPMPPVPRRLPESVLIGAFNHQLHLTSDRLKATPLTCEGCHQVSGEGPYASIPDHGVCAGCHGPDQTTLAAAAEPAMGRCVGCHAPGAGPGRARRFLTNDIGFTHAKHQATPDGTRVPCETCHYAMAKSTRSRSADITLPLMLDCRRCHNDPRRTPARVGMDRCEVCHSNPRIKTQPTPANHTAAKGGPGHGGLAREAR